MSEIFLPGIFCRGKRHNPRAVNDTKALKSDLPFRGCPTCRYEKMTIQTSKKFWPPVLFFVRVVVLHVLAIQQKKLAKMVWL